MHPTCGLDSACVPAALRWNTGHVRTQSHAFSYVSMTPSSQYTVICNFAEAQIVSQMLHGWLLSVIYLARECALFFAQFLQVSVTFFFLSQLWMQNNTHAINKLLL